eukprot:1083846-Prorocentrum_minimum.AAC.1
MFSVLVIKSGLQSLIRRAELALCSTEQEPCSYCPRCGGRSWTSWSSAPLWSPSTHRRTAERSSSPSTLTRTAQWAFGSLWRSGSSGRITGPACKVQPATFTRDGNSSMKLHEPLVSMRFGALRCVAGCVGSFTDPLSGSAQHYNHDRAFRDLHPICLAHCINTPACFHPHTGRRCPVNSAST